MSRIELADMVVLFMGHMFIPSYGNLQSVRQFKRFYSLLIIGARLPVGRLALPSRKYE
jgi:hypothetical protein